MICSPITDKGPAKEWLAAQMIWLKADARHMVPLPLTPNLLPEKERLSLRNPNGKEDEDIGLSGVKNGT